MFLLVLFVFGCFVSVSNCGGSCYVVVSWPKLFEIVFRCFRMFFVVLGCFMLIQVVTLCLGCSRWVLAWFSVLVVC